MQRRSVVVGIVLAIGVAGSVEARGPKLSVDVEAYCGDPVALDPVTGEAFGQNVGVVITDMSDDNGPVGPVVGNLTVTCTAAVKEGRGKPAQVVFATISMDDPGFGSIPIDCPLNLPVGATEWKATATVSGGDLRRARSDRCEEVPVM